MHSQELSWPQFAVDQTIAENANAEHADPATLKSLVRNIKGETERNVIISTLEKTHWNRKAAARQLGISYRGLLYKIHDYRLARPIGDVPDIPNNGTGKGKGNEQ